MPNLGPDYTLASIHIIKKRIERIVFIVNVVSTSLFLAFYGYMIYSRIHDSLANTIIYSIMGTILIVSLMFDIVFYKKSKENMNFLEKKKVNEDKRLKKEIVNIIKVVVKISSLGYATYELIAIDSSTIKMLTLILSYALFAFQIIVYIIADLIYKYFKYLYIGVSKDLDEINPILHPLSYKDIREANEQIMTDRDKAILEEINEQRIIDKDVSQNDIKLKQEMATGDKDITKKRICQDSIEAATGTLPIGKAFRLIKSKLKKNKK